MKHLNTVLFILIFSGNIFSQSIVGKWKTIDDNTGNPKSVVNIYLQDGKAYGDIIRLLNNDKQNPLCNECPNKLHNVPILGLTIINSLKNSNGTWKGDNGILDPENGKYYDVKIWRDGSKLNVRGYIGPFYRTQIWYLEEE